MDENKDCWAVVVRIKQKELAELYWLLRKSPECKYERDPEIYKRR